MLSNYRIEHQKMHSVYIFHFYSSLLKRSVLHLETSLVL